MTITLADAHTHLDQYDPSEISAILQRAGEAGVATILVAGVTEASSARAIELAEHFDGLLAGVGIQPSDVKAPIDDAAYLRLKTLAQSSSKVVCVSEVGLDFAEGMPDIELQRQALRQQVRLARELGLPVVFHSRERRGRLTDHYETLQVLREEKVEEIGGAFHYFMWDEEVAEACFALGLMVSLSKTLLRLPSLQEVVRDLPLDKIVLETDSYPQTFKKNRARWTEPKDVRLVADKVAELKGLTLEEVAEATSSNLLKMLRIQAFSPGGAPARWSG